MMICFTIQKVSNSLLMLISIESNIIRKMELDLPIGAQKRLMESWIGAVGFENITCAQVHPGTVCAYEISKRFGVVAKNNFLLYTALHLAPFLVFKMKTLKSKSRKEKVHILMRLLKRYLGSIAFMSSFVTICKATICAMTWVTYTSFEGLKDAYKFWVLFISIFSSATFFFEEEERRKQVALYAFIRAIPALYTMLARRRLFLIPHVDKLTFVSVFALLSMCYHSYKGHLSYSGIFQKVWGTH